MKLSKVFVNRLINLRHLPLLALTLIHGLIKMPNIAAAPSLGRMCGVEGEEVEGGGEG